jgi:multiple sugar transport system permease protein
MMAASILIMLPTLIIFFLAQKQFIEGITFTGIKG